MAAQGNPVGAAVTFLINRFYEALAIVNPNPKYSGVIVADDLLMEFPVVRDMVKDELERSGFVTTTDIDWTRTFTTNSWVIPNWNANTNDSYAMRDSLKAAGHKPDDLLPMFVMLRATIVPGTIWLNTYTELETKITESVQECEGHYTTQSGVDVCLFGSAAAAEG